VHGNLWRWVGRGDPWVHSHGGPPQPRRVGPCRQTLSTPSSAHEGAISPEPHPASSPRRGPPRARRSVGISGRSSAAACSGACRHACAAAEYWCADEAVIVTKQAVRPGNREWQSAVRSVRADSRIGPPSPCPANPWRTSTPRSQTLGTWEPAPLTDSHLTLVLPACPSAALQAAGSPFTG
jgi:hypothetical protein